MQKFKKLITTIRGRITKRTAIICVVVLIMLLLVAILRPKTINFSYSGGSCIAQLTILPNTVKQVPGSDFEAEVEGSLRVGGYPILGTRTCVKPLTSPREGRTSVLLAPFGLSFIGKKLTVQVPVAPTVSVDLLNKPLPSRKPVALKLSESDEVFTYSLAAKSQSVACAPVGGSIHCDLAKLKLEQGQAHELSLKKQFQYEKSQLITKKQIEILPAVTVTSTSVQPDQIIYDKLSQLTLETDRALAAAKASLRSIDGDNSKEYPISVEVEGQRIGVAVAEDLPRESKFQLQLLDVESVDGSALAEEFSVGFTTSGGPKVTGVSVGDSGVDPHATIVLQLDQAIKSGQNLQKLVKITGGSATMSAQNNQILVKLGGLGRCTAFSISISKGLISANDVKSSQEWKLNSRTRCYTMSTIGYSVQGRPINAYHFGSGSQTMLFTGAIHGNELSSKYLLNSFIANLEASGAIPANRQIIIVPVVNPDGVAVASRYNARKVNLNRNFPTHNWTSDIIVSSGKTEEGTGGPAALSEPESVTLARFTQRLDPQLVVTYHSVGSLVNGNDVGIATSLGPQYARLAGYRYIPNAATSAAFGFDMTGTYEDWLAQRGTPAILVELNTNTGNHFWQNKQAMWAVLNF